MSDEANEKTETTQDEAAETAPEPDASADAVSEPEEAQAAPEAAEEAPAEPDPLDDLPWKERRRILRSREPHTARPQQSPEERAAARADRRKAKGNERRKE